MEVSGQPHAPDIFTPETEPQLPTEKLHVDWMDRRLLLDAFKWGELHCPLARDTGPVQNRARSSVVTKINKKQRLYSK